MPKKSKAVRETQNYKFELTGGFSVDKNFTPELSYNGGIMSFALPDGRVVQLIVALEIEEANGRHHRQITSQHEMDELGFECLDYENVQFIEMENE